MKAIYKYTVDKDPTFISIPKGAKIVHVDKQRDSACFWAIVDTEARMENRIFRVVGTGWDISGYYYIGTYQDGPFVWHIVEQPIPPEYTKNDWR